MFLLDHQLDRFWDLFSHDMGIDLGTANTLIYVRGQGVVLCEPSVVAIHKGTRRLLAVGEEAKRMLGRTPGNILAIRPMKDGVIADFETTESMLRYFIRKVHNRRTFISPRVVVAVPSGITEVERRAVKDSVLHAGAREVYLVDQPLAAAYGVGMNVEDPVGNMIVGIGGGTTEVAIISLKADVTSRSVRIGGYELDNSIIAHLKRTYNLMIGETTAENIKIRIGSAYPLEQEMTMEVKGRDLVTGLPKTITVTSEEVREAMSEPVHEIIESIRGILEITPPEISGDLVDRGLVMAGGSSLLRGLDRLIHEETGGLPVRVADDPLTATCLGTGKFLNDINLLKQVNRQPRLE